MPPTACPAERTGSRPEQIVCGQGETATTKSPEAAPLRGELDGGESVALAGIGAIGDGT